MSGVVPKGLKNRCLGVRDFVWAVYRAIIPHVTPENRGLVIPEQNVRFGMWKSGARKKRFADIDSVKDAGKSQNRGGEYGGGVGKR